MNDVYRTSDQLFAAYLMERGFYCVRAIPSGDKRFPERRDFLFTDVTNAKELEDDFYRYKKETMSARSLLEKTRTTRHILREGLSEEDLENLKRGQA